MKKIILAAFTASVLGLGFAAMPADAAPWDHHHHRHPHCKVVKVWKHGHPVWFKKCW